MRNLLLLSLSLRPLEKLHCLWPQKQELSDVREIGDYVKVTPTKFDKVFIIQLLELSVENAFRIIADGNGERLSLVFINFNTFVCFECDLNSLKTKKSLSFRYEKPSSLFSRRYWSTSNGLWSHYKRNQVVSFTMSLKLRQVFKLMIVRWRNQPIRTREIRLQSIREHTSSINLKILLK